GQVTGLSEQERLFFEPRFNHDFSNVRIHTGARATQSARQISARAYTIGNHIVFNEGQYQPHSEQGQRLVAHELTHVVQQGDGMAAKSVQRSTDFCTPYPTAADATDAEWWIRNTYMRAEGIESFGTEVYNLYDS